MTLLIDTHVLLWWAAGAPLRSDAAAAIADPSNEVYVSAATVWEISIKTALGKLRVDGDLDAVIEQDFGALDITLDDGRRAGALPTHHRDPFDRMLIAQAQHRGLTVVTRDGAFEAYDVALMAA